MQIRNPDIPKTVACQAELQQLSVRYLVDITPYEQTGILAVLFNEAVRGCAQSGVPLEVVRVAFDDLYAGVFPKEHAV